VVPEDPLFVAIEPSTGEDVLTPLYSVIWCAIEVPAPHVIVTDVPPVPVALPHQTSTFTLPVCKRPTNVQVMFVVDRDVMVVAVPRFMKHPARKFPEVAAAIV
jgi:hypothetical protein